MLAKRFAAVTRRLSSTAPSATAASGRKLSPAATPVPATASSLPVEDESVQLSGHGLLSVTNKLHIVDTQSLEKWPVFRVMGSDGSLLPGADALPAEMSQEKVVSMYKTMVRIQALDDIFYNAQRQGRISSSQAHIQSRANIFLWHKVIYNLDASFRTNSLNDLVVGVSGTAAPWVAL